MDCYFKDFPSRKILVGFDPNILAQLFGLERLEYEQVINLPGVTFDNLVIVINPESQWIMVSAVTDNIDPTSIELELRKLDGIMKIILISIVSVKAAMVGVLVCPKINSFKELQNEKTTIRLSPNLRMLCVTKEELESEKLLNDWGRNVTKKIELNLQDNCLDIKQSVKSLETLAGTMMASMAQTSQNLPKMTHHIPTKIVTILMNPQQIETVQDKAKWKFISAPFGGGKTVVLAEIAKILLKV